MRGHDRILSRRAAGRHRPAPSPRRAGPVPAAVRERMVAVLVRYVREEARRG
ncbi:hypothetical protein M2302_000731 [Micromonospora sp. A200]|nr:hypothetical protein [Micromonospora sp. A200]